MKPDYFFVRVSGRYEKIPFSLLTYAESNKNYILFHLGEHTHEVLTSLKAVEAILPPRQFCRIHRSFIVSLDKITAFDEQHAYLAGTTLPIGEKYRDAILRRVPLLGRSNAHTSRT